MYKKRFIFVLVLLFITAILCAQRDWTKVKLKVTEVAGKVYMIEGAGGNIGISAGKDGVLMIDTQYKPLCEKIKKAIKDLGCGDLKLIINTHMHGDHTNGNIGFSKDVPIISHINVRERLENPSTIDGRERKAAPREQLPNITFNDRMIIYFNDEPVILRYMPPGHTDGDTIIWFTESNVVHMGDLYFARAFPYIDLDNGGDVEGFIKNVETILDMLPLDVKLIPGHGPLSDLEDLANYHKMLKSTTKIIKDEIDAGKTADEIKKSGVLNKWDSWGKGFINTDRWIDICYRGFKKE